MQIAVNCGTTNRCRIGVLERKERRVRPTMAKIFPNLLKTVGHSILAEGGQVLGVSSLEGSRGCRGGTR